MGEGVRAHLRALLPSLSLVAFALFAVYGAALSVLLPAQVAAIDPGNKVAALATVTSLSFAFTLFSQPIVGALSDGTRSRLGRRTPWMLVGAVVGGGFLVGLGAVDSVVWVAVFWIVVQFSLNGADAASAAFVVDSFTPARRGRVLGLVGAAGIVGGAAGAAAAGALAPDRQLAYTALGLLVVASVAVFAVLTRESANKTPARERRSLAAFLRGFWIAPGRHPDFAWAFASRLIFVVGRQGVYGYLFYLLTDHIGVAELDAPGLVAVVTVVGGGSIVVGLVCGGLLSDRIGRRKPFVVAAGLGLVVALVIPLAWPTVPAILIFAAVQGVGFGVFTACSTALVTQVLPSRDGAAKDLGIYNAATNIGQVIAPVLAATTISLAGYPGLFVAAMVGAAVAALLVLPIRGVR